MYCFCFHLKNLEGKPELSSRHIAVIVDTIRLGYFFFLKFFLEMKVEVFPLAGNKQHFLTRLENFG